MDQPASIHVPVMPAEVLAWLDPQPGGTFLDGTLGGGGHTRLLAEAVGEQGTVIGLDRDAQAVQRARETLPSPPVHAIQSDFRSLAQVLSDDGIDGLDGILLDLGLSSDQLADRDRGFSFSADGELDLRFDTRVGEPAWKLVNRMPEKPLADLIYQFGEERFSRRIAKRIVSVRRQSPIRTAGQLANLVRGCIPARTRGRIDAATRTFQALRIAVNDELGALTALLEEAPNCLKPGGRLVVISFHSLEDRLVKHGFRADNRYMILTKKPIRPNQTEVENNPRSRSAKLRAAARAVDP